MLFYIIGLLAAIVLAPLIGRYLFRKGVDREVAALISTGASRVGPLQLATRWNSLPEPLQRHLRFAIKQRAASIRSVRVEHGGTFRTRPEQRWLPIHGVEHFTASTPGFVWSATVDLAPLLWIDARDQLRDRSGSMLVKFESLFTIVNAGGPQIDQGSSLRWLAEAVWFPYALVGDAIRWESLTSEAARATLMQDGAPVTGTIEFDTEGRMAAIRGERYYYAGGESVLKPWVARCGEYREFGPFRVPSHVEVAWILDGVEFIYARFDVTAIGYDAASGIARSTIFDQ
jgi:hypothetical protein